jgi:hypothetical protein
MGYLLQVVAFDASHVLTDYMVDDGLMPNFYSCGRALAV